MGHFYNIDPETCTKEELEKAIAFCKENEENFHTKEQSAKVFINSIYGALANKFYYNSNIAMAESITLQGQDLIKYSVIKVNEYFENYWHTDYEVHKQIALYMKNHFADFDVNGFLERAKHKVIVGNSLQIYGDSVVGSTKIHLSTGEYVEIEKLFNENCVSDAEDKIRVNSDKLIYTFDTVNHNVCVHPIKYIMRHKTRKELWRVTDDYGNTVIATADHSFAVLRNNIIVNVPAKDMNVETDKLISYNKDVQSTFSYGAINSIESLGECNEYVYDIEIDTNDDSAHYFFGNNILVHNTDSISKDSIIRTHSHPDGITIEDFYNENSSNAGECTLAGHESVHTTDKVLNYDSNLYFGDVKRIIRHNVNKKKWRLKTKSGKIIECTDNHSLVVFRNGQQIKVKPSEIVSTDKVLTVDIQK